MKTKDFTYDLPEELIAQYPLAQRDFSRLLTLDGKTGEICHLHFRDLLQLLRPNDCLVLNNTKVMPARLLGQRQDTLGNVEILLLKRWQNNCWETIVRPGKKVKPGHIISFLEGELLGKVVEILPSGNRIIEFQFQGIWEEIIDRAGIMPLPPYITKPLTEKDRYQTVFARHTGSAAAPTAGLHFTPDLLEKLKNMGVFQAEITLHVGLGTFRPVKVDDVKKHVMHEEWYDISEDQAEIIRTAKKRGGRIIPVGTTSMRTLESVFSLHQDIVSGCGTTDIFIYPGYTFKVADALITNFHLPESTLLMLVSAFAGSENIQKAYETAVKEKYRFFSFGDAMFLTPTLNIENQM